MKNKIQVFILIFAFFFAQYLFANNQSRTFEATTLNKLIEELVTYNPELQSLTAKINAAHAFIPQSSALEDPQFSFEASNIPVNNASLSRTPMTGIQLYLRQKIPFPGKLRLKKKIAKAQKTQAIQEHLEKLNQLVAKFKQVYFDYGYITEAIQITQKTQRRLNALVTTLEARYATGAVPQQDVLKTKVEFSKVKESLIKLENLKKVYRERINTLLVRPNQTPLLVRISDKKLSVISLELEKLQELAKASRPQLEKEKSNVEAFKQKHKLAKMDFLPDFEFSAGYRIRDNSLSETISGEDFFSGGVSINIPIWGFRKQGKKITQERYLLHAAKQIKLSHEQEVAYQVSQYYFETEQLEEQHQLFLSRIIPESKAALESSRKSYEAKEVDYLNLITNELSLFQNQLSLAKYFYEHEKKAALLEMAIGQPLFKAQGDHL